jgi:hypothetical protein
MTKSRSQCALAAVSAGGGDQAEYCGADTIARVAPG